jgi:hypothetical protein
VDTPDAGNSTHAAFPNAACRVDGANRRKVVQRRCIEEADASRRADSFKAARAVRFAFRQALIQQESSQKREVLMRVVRRGPAVLLFQVMAVLLSSCSETLGPLEVQIRVRNAASVALEDVLVEFPEETELYGTIQPGQVSRYHRVRPAYRYAYAEANVSGKLLRLMPIDFVGEEFLESGSYTYEIGITENLQSLTFRLVRD